ncbi:hypothetical protein D869_gp327 [Caulobacter phage CcrRogue]|uniref:Uncharacterized protein n=1 Tax=Caulobacter phage CcrRogue TaxID=2927986 RepID=K4K302_9CAUD|nr:hypothetical protein D869_gp327 [Caulobacter phage CcrRogue]AFU86587.1 hypothetical protein CcrRogue_gp105 [Caulobacter phage CcrRogue]
MREGYGGLKIIDGLVGGILPIKDDIIPVKDDVSTGFPDGDALAPLDYG